MLGKGSGRLSGQTRLSGQLSLFGSQISAGFPLHAGAHGRPCPLSVPDQSVHGNVPRGNEGHGHDDGGGCSIPDVCIDERRLPLFIARATLRGLIAVLEARATGDAAR